MGCNSVKPKRKTHISKPCYFVHLYQIKYKPSEHKFIKKSYLNGSIKSVMSEDFSRVSFGSMDYDSVHSENKLDEFLTYENHINIEELIKYLRSKNK